MRCLIADALKGSENGKIRGKGFKHFIRLWKKGTKKKLTQGNHRIKLIRQNIMTEWKRMLAWNSSIH